MNNLQRFNGTASVVEQWLGVFPCTFFGFTRLVQSFSKAQLAGLRAVPADRVLLETDTPYFQDTGTHSLG